MLADQPADCRGIAVVAEIARRCEIDAQLEAGDRRNRHAAGILPQSRSGDRGGCGVTRLRYRHEEGVPLSVSTDETGMEPDPRRIEAERRARKIQQQGSRCHIVIDVQGVGRRRGARKLRPGVSVRVRPRECDRIEQPVRQTAPPRTHASRGECVRRGRRTRRTESLQRVCAQIRAVQIEGVARGEGALKRERHRHPPAIRQELVQPHRSRNVRGVVGHV